MSHRIVILGAGTAGTTLANRLVSHHRDDLSVTVIDPETEHLYQPGLLFLPFGAQDEDKMVRPRIRTLDERVLWITEAVDRVDKDSRTVLLENGDTVGYDYLVIATGTKINPDMTPGMVGDHWHENIFDFYTLEGSLALRDAMAKFDGGRLVVNVVEMPIKCPVAPLEFLFLADAFFRKRGIRDDVELVYATPLDSAFTKPAASKSLGHFLAEKGVRMETEYNTAEVDDEAGKLISYDEREVEYDLLVTIPIHSGMDFIERSGLGNELNFVPTHKTTLQSKLDERIFALGDATDLPSSKAGSVAHFQAEVLEENLLHALDGEPLEEGFDGHANCFIETGDNKALLIDFNYETEPLPGSFPIPGVGPMRLLKETRLNHLGKLAFRWVYWNGLLKGRPLPVPTRMSMAGKHPIQQSAA